MNKSTHVLGGIALSLGCGAAISLPEQSLISLGCLAAASTFGAILPDIDKKNTAISNKHPVISFVVRLVTTHRGITHTLLALLIFAGLLYFPVRALGIAPVIWSYYGLITGYMSHLILDMLNPEGIPLFFPIKFKISIFKIKTGGIGEYIVRLILFISVIWLFYMSLTKAGIMKPIPLFGIK